LHVAFQASGLLDVKDGIEYKYKGDVKVFL